MIREIVSTPHKDWTQYFDVVGKRKPRQIIYNMMKFSKNTGIVIDIGCGTGFESIALAK